MEFSLKEIIDLMKKRFVWITLCTIIGLCLSYGISKYIIRPTYVASVQMYVIPEDKDDAADLNGLTYAQKVVTTYISFLQTKTFYKQVVEEGKLSYTPDAVKGMTDIKSINNTEIFEISVTSFQADDSFQIVNAMQTVVPRLIKSIKQTAQIRVVDPVVMPTSPSSPNILINTMVGGVLGFVFSVLISLLWEMFDINLKNKEDLINRYQLPILGVIPNFKLFSKRKRLRKIRKSVFRKHKKRSKAEEKQTQAEEKQTQAEEKQTEAEEKRTEIEEKSNLCESFAISEAYKSFRTNLRFTLPGNECKKVLITSPSPQDGKSTTSTNIAITLAQTGAKVLIMDCDLRKGRIHSFLNIKSAPGISDTLSGMVDVSDIIQTTAYDNLQAITMGTISPNPTELLGSVLMEELMKKLETEYDYIIMDTPPVGVVSDSLSLVKLAEGIVIVVREGVTSHPNIVSALTKYKFSNANILGFLINEVSFEQDRKSKSGYYEYRYGSYYDD